LGKPAASTFDGDFPCAGRTQIQAGLAQLLSLAGMEFSYDENPKWLKVYLLFDISENTVRSETEKMGALQVQQEKQLIERSQDETYLQERQRQPDQVPSRLYSAMDAAKVRIEPRPKKGEEKGEHDDWRDMKVLCSRPRTTGLACQEHKLLL
jgi:hypothetical protein